MKTLQAETFMSDKRRNKKKPVSLTGMVVSLFGACEIMKQGFADQGNCWVMALGVLCLVWGIWRLNK